MCQKNQMTSHVNGFSFFGEGMCGHSCELRPARPVGCQTRRGQNWTLDPDMEEVSQAGPISGLVGSRGQAFPTLASRGGVKCAQGSQQAIDG